MFGKKFLKSFRKQIMEIQNVVELISYCNVNERICPQPQLWSKLWDMLNDKERVGVAGWNPPLPQILAAWWNTSPSEKKFRFEQHIIWANSHGQIKEISDLLTSLAEENWLHLQDS